MKESNRRQHVRYHAQQLLIDVRPLGSDALLDRVKGVDFSAHGLAFVMSGQGYQVGDRLELNIKLEKVVLGQLIAEVRNCWEDRCGVEFVFNTDYMKTAAVLDGLEAITNLLKTSRSVDTGTGLRAKKKRDRFSNKL